MRSPALGRTIQRRLASTESKFVGAEDNAFNRERKAVKDHAAATSDLLVSILLTHWGEQCWNDKVNYHKKE
ncbi:hypothetical protein LAWI1_G005253 [Lachnellula willkommii]|uniref:Uncharacterized protein n=1 Tax=Lachnellula willkommii TaxID=215461 RepID=A0A559M441_9HELO|nr:hypothetical protein LAWI1_G005253 [Lachnellula willkommii]